MKPFFSVVIPLYNKEKEIINTISSVLHQTFEDFEVIIVNDGSTDNGLQKLDTIKDDRIKVFTIKNQGVSYARNFGIQQSQSDLIAFLDADDYWEIFHLEDLKELYESYPNCGMYCKAYDKHKGDIKIRSLFNTIPKDLNWKGIVNDYFAASTANAIAWTSAVMIPKSILTDIGGFDESITLGAGEDTDLWMRIALKFKVAFYNKVSAIHNLDAENRITKSNTNQRAFIDLGKYEDLAKTNPSLKTYIDRNRFAIGIQYKIAGNSIKAKEYFNTINRSNLNFKQKLLVNLNTKGLKMMIAIHDFLNKKGVHLSLFR